MKTNCLIMLIVGLLASSGISCSKKASVPTAPRADSLQQGDAHFFAGHYEEAADAYTTFLHQNPYGKHRDRAIFRLAMCQAIEESAIFDLKEATTQFNRLRECCKNSLYTRQAEVVLGFHDSIEPLKTRLSNQEKEIRDLKDQLKKQIEVAEHIHADRNKARDQLRQLESDLKQKKEEVDLQRREFERQIKLLKDELEQLKRIDMERRPSRPPD